jgi:glycine C-acetyltransferase
MSQKLYKLLDSALDNLTSAGLFKPEFPLDSAQGHRVEIAGKKYLNFTSSDFLGLATNERVKKAAMASITKFGNGLASPRVITGTQSLHHDLEESLAEFLGKESAMLFPSSYDMGVGFFESMFNDQDYIFCDIYTHPSLVDGIYRTSVQKFVYLRSDLDDLEDQLKRSPRARFRLIVVEGVYALDGQIADLKRVCELAKAYDALVLLHDPYGLGILGAKGRGTAEHCEVVDNVDLICGSFAQALSGVELGFVAGPKTVIEWLKQNSKPYVYCASPAPAVLGAAAESLVLVGEMKRQREQLIYNAEFFRTRLKRMGWTVVASPHPIVAVVTADAVKTQRLTDALFDEGLFVLGLCYPLVPKGVARIRLQLHIDHTERDLGQLANALETHGKKLKILSAER